MVAAIRLFDVDNDLMGAAQRQPRGHAKHRVGLHLLEEILNHPGQGDEMFLRLVLPTPQALYIRGQILIDHA